MTLIKREDAIEAIKKEIQDFEANYMHGEDDEEYGHDIGFVAGLHRAKTFIRSLPSAEPQADLISRADAIEAVPDTMADMFENCRNCKLLDREQVRDILSTLPSAEHKDCTDFLCWLLEEIMDEENWELNAEADGEIIARKLKKLGLLDSKDGYYIRTPMYEALSAEAEWIPCSERLRRELIISMNDDIPMWKGEEVVRCKDCKYLYKDDKCPLRTWFTHTEDDYCSYGKRREDGEA